MYCMTYSTTFLTMYAGLTYDYINVASIMDFMAAGESMSSDGVAELIASWLSDFRLTVKYADTVRENEWIATAGVAWCATKLTEPVRWAINIALTPKLSSFWRSNFGGHPIIPVRSEKVKEAYRAKRMAKQGDKSERHDNGEHDNQDAHGKHDKRGGSSASKGETMTV
jgi:hypothetical protein